MSQIKTLLLIIFLAGITTTSYSQNIGVGTTTPDPSAQLHISDTRRGLLIPNVSLTDVSVPAPVTSPATGLLIWNTNASVIGGQGAGYYYWDGSNWTNLIGPAGPPGTDGIDGVDGAPGAVGPTGPPGMDGADGMDGATGAVGPAGPPGMDGADGMDGATGAVGPAGPPGMDGADGMDGATGAVGPTGPQGESCWDLNSNGVLDTGEDINNDGVGSALDCSGSNTLDEAYDEGGSGAGRVITTDAGAVELNGAGGLIVDATTTTLSEAVRVDNGNATSSSEAVLGWSGVSGANVVSQGVRGNARITNATAQYDGAYGVFGAAYGTTINSTVNLNASIGSYNKAVGVGGGIGSRNSYIGSAQDIIAAVYGGTGLHNSGSGTVTGSKLYAGLFTGNGRTLGLWGENSTYMELVPGQQSQIYDAGVIGFYNSAANGGNNGASTGTPDTYMSIETNVTDATNKALVLQARSTGNVGVGTAAPHPSAKLHIQDANKGLLVPNVAIPNVATATPVASPATGLMVWNTNASTTGGSGTGYYYWTGSMWTRMLAGSLDHNTLDEAYDEGGPGAGRIITADAGTVEINGTGGLKVDANTTTVMNATEVFGTNGTQSSRAFLGRVGTDLGNTYSTGVTGRANYTVATNIFDGAYGTFGGVYHPTDGTINLNSTIGSVNKAVGVGGGIGSRTSVTGSAQDVIASIWGNTGHHNVGGGTITGSRMYAGLFSGNGRTLGLWGENSTYIEMLPQMQSQIYDAAVIGFYNSAANGGNNGGGTGTADTYMSIETNVSDATNKALVMQARSTGNVGIGIAAPHPSAKLHIQDANKGLLMPNVSISNVANAAPVTSPATGLMVWNTNATVTGGNGAGYYYWSGNAWTPVKDAPVVVTNNTLDEAYDEGGAGAGRIINADAGTVEVNGTGGFQVDASTTSLLSAIKVDNTNGTTSTEAFIGYSGVSGTNVVSQSVRGNSRITNATAQYDGAYGVFGATYGTTATSTINLNATIGSANKAVGIGGGLGSRNDIIGSAQDIVASVYGGTGFHNSGGGTITGCRLYAGLFTGNGRTLGLWGENSTYMEFMPRWQSRDYDTGIIGFYNSDPNGGNNDSDIGSGDNYMSIETNVTDATVKHLALQVRSGGSVGVGTSTPTAKLSVNGSANKTGGGVWAVFSDASLKENVSDYKEGLDLIKLVNPVNFSYNEKMEAIWGEDKANKGRIYQGVIAQELQEIAPDMVREVSLEDEDGKPSSETVLEVDPNKFTYALINAIKEQQAQIDELKKLVKELQNEKSDKQGTH